MGWADGLEQFARLLRSPQYLDQADAIDGTFDLWYSEAVKYAQSQQNPPEFIRATVSCIPQLLGGSSGFLLDPALEDYVMKKATSAFTKLCTIFREKPKFAALLVQPPGQPLVEALKTVALPLLEHVATHDGAPTGHRVDVMGALRALIGLPLMLPPLEFNCLAPELGFNIQSQRGGAGEPPFMPTLNAFLPVAMQTGYDDMLRRSVLDLFLLFHDRNVQSAPPARSPAASPTPGAQPQSGMPLVRYLAAYAGDQLAFEYLWLMGLPQDPDGVALILDRVGRAGKSPATAQMPLELLTALNFILRRTQQGPAIIDLESAPQQRALVAILLACDQVKSSYKEREDEAQQPRAEGGQAGAAGLVGERSQELLDVLSAPNAEPFLEVALHPVTTETLTTVAALSDRFTEATWLTTLLPFLDEQIGRMQLSGEQVEQARAVGWLSEALRAGACHNHKTRRAISGQRRPACPRLPAIRPHAPPALLDADLSVFPVGGIGGPELVMRLLGVHHSTASSDLYTPPTDPATQQVVMRLLGVTQEVPAFGILTELATTAPALIRAHEEAVGLSLEATAKTLDAMAAAGYSDQSLLEAILTYLRALSPHVTAPNAPRMFEAALRALSLAHTDVFRTMYTDEVLGAVLRKVAPETTFTEPTLQLALRLGGVATRSQLALFAPRVVLADPAIPVRIEALKALIHRPQLLPGLGDAILGCCQTAAALDREADSSSVHLQISEVPFAAAAIPVLALLAVVSPPHMGRALPLLLRYGEALAQNMANMANMAAGEPDPRLTRALDQVAEGASPDGLLQFALSREGLAMLPRLETQSAGWQRLTDRLYVQGYLRRTSAAPHAPYMLGPLPEAQRSLAAPLAGELEVLQEQVTRGLAEGRILEALRAAYQVRMRHGGAYVSSGVAALVGQRLLPALLQCGLLPCPAQGPQGPVLRPEEIANSEDYLALIEEVERMFGEEAEASLRLSALKECLHMAVVQQFLAQGQVGPARSWLQAHWVQSPGLLAALDRYEAEHPPVMATLAPATTVPPVPQQQAVLMPQPGPMYVAGPPVAPDPIFVMPAPPAPLARPREPEPAERESPPTAFSHPPPEYAPQPRRAVAIYAPSLNPPPITASTVDQRALEGARARVVGLAPRTEAAAPAAVAISFPVAPTEEPRSVFPASAVLMDLLCPRIAVVGPTGVGKTSMINQFVTSDYNAVHYQTPGTEPYWKTYSFEGQELRLEIEDTQGFDTTDRIQPFREIEEGAQHFHNKSRQAYIVVFDVCAHNTFVECCDILTRLANQSRQRGHKLPAVLVGNKADADARREVTTEDAALIARLFQCEYCECSARRNEGVVAVFQRVITRIKETFRPRTVKQLGRISAQAIHCAERSGYLLKMGFFRHNWSKRWFILSGRYLFYYKTPRSDSPQGVLVVPDFNNIEMVAAQPPCLELRSPKRSFYIRPLEELPNAEGRKDLADWEQAIRAALARPGFDYFLDGDRSPTLDIPTLAAALDRVTNGQVVLQSTGGVTATATATETGEAAVAITAPANLVQNPVAAAAAAAAAQAPAR
ncbi:putative Ras-like protein family member 10A [Paratrimastix pyriformis]|uniref:small monomeric GTPase n=1 Tax=Paratrimastix pyriformis TaxID=342808 RepID=A0ABQ8UXY5_9EUKA|nr:putative Ras-like protein family member 10A [Paratrimastix pyriformis]